MRYNLNALGVYEMNAQEKKEVEGGGFLAIAAVVLAVAYIAGTLLSIGKGRNPHTNGAL